MTDSENRSGMLMVIFSISMVLLVFVLYFLLKNIILIVICYFIDQRKKIVLVSGTKEKVTPTKSRYEKYHI